MVDYLALFTFKKLSYKTALELAQGIESLAKNVRESNVPVYDVLSITGPATTVGQNPVNQVEDNAASRTPPTCYRCDKLRHYALVAKAQPKPRHYYAAQTRTLCLEYHIPWKSHTLECIS